MVMVVGQMVAVVRNQIHRPIQVVMLNLAAVGVGVLILKAVVASVVLVVVAVVAAVISPTSMAVMGEMAVLEGVGVLVVP
ncbi:membrane protein [Beggiatoa sp. SS]|nr:membrane protein [Beggiatoa sp. SS]